MDQAPPGGAPIPFFSHEPLNGFSLELAKLGFVPAFRVGQVPLVPTLLFLTRALLCRFERLFFFRSLNYLWVSVLFSHWRKEVYFDVPSKVRGHNWGREVKNKLLKEHWIEVSSRYYLNCEGVISLSFKKNVQSVHFPHHLLTHRFNSLFYEFLMSRLLIWSSSSSSQKLPSHDSMRSAWKTVLLFFPVSRFLPMHLFPMLAFPQIWVSVTLLPNRIRLRLVLAKVVNMMEFPKRKTRDTNQVGTIPTHLSIRAAVSQRTFLSHTRCNEAPLNFILLMSHLDIQLNISNRLGYIHHLSN